MTHFSAMGSKMAQETITKVKHRYILQETIEQAKQSLNNMNYDYNVLVLSLP